MHCEILVDRQMNKCGQRMLHAMDLAAASAGVRISKNFIYKGNAELLMTYGLGSTERRAWIDRHRAAGKIVIGWDLGYWARKEYMRLTIGQDHPQLKISKQPSGRFQKFSLQLMEKSSVSGPIILVGLGKKSRAQFGFCGAEWERRKLAEIQLAYPSTQIWYRPKKEESDDLGVPCAFGKIEDAIDGASLVVCHHSNVAVDACLAGIPVVCDDGAAAALYGRDLSHPVIPSRAQRLQFLQNLSWWQWSPTEAGQAWTFIKKNLG